MDGLPNLAAKQSGDIAYSAKCLSWLEIFGMTLVTAVSETPGNPQVTFPEASRLHISQRGKRKVKTMHAGQDRSNRNICRGTHGQGGEGNDRGWERSFPDGSVKGLSWILDVLDDLAAFADHRGETALKAELEQARSRASDLLTKEEGKVQQR
jgi:hypothetical protein